MVALIIAAQKHQTEMNHNEKPRPAVTGAKVVAPNHEQKQLDTEKGHTSMVAA